MNTGVLVVTSRLYVEAVLLRLPSDLDGAARLHEPGWLDQDTADEVLHSGNFSWCPLPSSTFTNLCALARSPLATKHDLATTVLN